MLIVCVVNEYVKVRVNKEFRSKFDIFIYIKGNVYYKVFNIEDFEENKVFMIIKLK